MIVGSTAIKKFDSSWREPKDLDTILLEGSAIHLGGQGDVHVLPYEQYQALSKYVEDGVLNLYGNYILKVSHSFFDVNWEKTTKDILMMQERYGFRDVDMEVFKPLYKFWTQYHGGKDKVNLNKTNEEFFMDGVSSIRQYEHDFIHECVAYYDRPLYERIKEDLTKAAVSKKLFDTLPFEDQLKLCREEIYATALERYVITGKTKNYREAYKLALKQLVTSMTKGWFPRFIICNLTDLKKPDINFIQKFEEKTQCN